MCISYHLMKGVIKLVHSLRRFKTFLFFTIIYMCFLTGCGRSSEAGNASAGDGEKKPPSSETPVPSATKTGSDKTESRELKIYAINFDTDEVEDSVVYIPADEEISVRLVADAVIAGFDNYGIEVRLNDAVEENGNAVVDFKKNEDGSGIFGETTKKVEETALNCISYSILDNIPEVQGIIFRIDGQAYKTENFSFEENYVYDTR